MRFFLGLSLLLIGMLGGLSGCISQEEGRGRLSENPTAPISTATTSPLPLPTVTRRPWPTRHPTATHTSTPRFAFNYEKMPLVPPDPAEVAERARILTCNPPCWFGLEPGLSTLEDLRNLWGKWSEVFWEWDTETQTYQGYLTNPAFYMGFEADRRGVITYMEIKPKTQTLPEYAPSQYLRRLGPPSWDARSFVWSGIGGEEPITDTSALLVFYFGYPDRYVVMELLDFTPDLGTSLPVRFSACIPQPDFFTTYFSYPRETFHQAEIWQKQEYTDPPARFLTTPEEIWEQIIKEQAPFCVEMALIDE